MGGYEIGRLDPRKLGDGAASIQLACARWMEQPNLNYARLKPVEALNTSRVCCRPRDRAITTAASNTASHSFELLLAGRRGTTAWRFTRAELTMCGLEKSSSREQESAHEQALPRRRASGSTTTSSAKAQSYARRSQSRINGRANVAAGVRT